ncbi:uncharacterized protein LOC117321619 [Pecten maximus]|uniref:uncharacterized protein LOC117321619 n=1 Tax=Pecten maximus TaxID=6579 RepID=UPI001458389B|nr:uncharacterized protein LOC117321619 [Pecten maximus]
MDDQISELTSCVPKTWTLYKVWGINAWNKWAKVANQGRELGEPPIPHANSLELVSPKELDHYLKDFVNKMRRADGIVFKKASAQNIFRGLAAHLVEYLKCPHLNFMDHNDNNFIEFRKAAYGTTKILRGRKQIQDPSDEIDQGNRLWDKHFDSLDTPEGLLQAVYAFNTFVFGVESIKSHSSLVANQYCLGSDKEGKFIKFNGNLKETRMSEEANSIFSVEERKLYDTGECDSVYNIYKKYLNSIQANGKFYILPSATKCNAGKERKMKGFSSIAMNSSQIQDLQKHMVSSRSYRKLHLLKDFDTERQRFNIHPSYLSKLTGSEDISLALDKMLSPYRMENCAEGLLSEENENFILKTMCNATQNADTTQISASNEVQQELRANPTTASFRSLGIEPNLLPTIPNMIRGKPNMMTHTPHSMTGTPSIMTHTPHSMTCTTKMMTQTPHSKTDTPNMIACTPHSMTCTPNMMTHTPHSMTGTPNIMTHTPHSMTCTPNIITHTPHSMTCTPNIITHTSNLKANTTTQNMMTHTPNMMTHSPNMMTHSPNMMTGISLERGTQNHRCNPSMHLLNIQTSAETSWFENRVPLEEQTSHPTTNVDKPQDPVEDNRSSICHTENYLERCDDTESCQQFQQHRRAITTGCYKNIAGVLPSQSGMEYLYPNTNDIASKYTDTPHLRSQAPQCHLKGGIGTSMSGTVQTFHTAPFSENFPQTSIQYLNTTAHQPQSLQMDNTSSVHPKRQSLSNASDIYRSPPTMSHQLFKHNRTTTPRPTNQFRHLVSLLSRAPVSNHCPPLNYESLSVSHETFSPVSGMTPDELHNQNLKRQKLYGRGQQTSPSSILLQQQMSPSSILLQQQMSPSSILIQQQMSPSSTLLQQQQQMSPSSVLLKQKELSARDNLNDHLYQGLQKTHNSEQNNLEIPTMEKSVRKRRASACIIETQNSIKRSKGGIPNSMEEGIHGQNDKRTTASAQTMSVPLTGYTPLSETLQDIVSSQFPGMTDQNENSVVDNGTTNHEEINPGAKTKQNQAKLEETITDKRGQDMEFKQTNLSTKNRNSASNSLDQNIKELLDFDPLLRKSFHKKCTDWFIRHKSRFEMNKLLTSESKGSNTFSDSTKDDETSENSSDENQQENLNQSVDEVVGNTTTGNMIESKAGRKTMTEMDINSMYDSLTSDNPNQIGLKVKTGSAMVDVRPEQNTTDSQEIKSEDGSQVICVADDVKCMSALYVD